LKYITLRYFNVAGAHPNGSIGESHRIETHLIPLILKTLTKEKDTVSIFGTDYDTPDGTCIRDYIHVCDLAVAHRTALEVILSGEKNYSINLGTGKGVSVQEIISHCEAVTRCMVPVVIADRRPGDPPVLVASNQYAKDILNFKPQYGDIREIIKTAWEWERKRTY
jgi:UDP-glucose 4-epimerase